MPMRPVARALAGLLLVALGLGLTLLVPPAAAGERPHKLTRFEKFLLFLQPFVSPKPPPFPDPPPNMTTLCAMVGRACETHVVRTPDGYLLNLVHILGARPGATPVFIQHGFIVNTPLFLTRRDGSDLGYVLLDAGFDVWFGDSRGTTYSRSHIRMDPDKDKEFWNFSFHEMGIIDTPVFIDYVLEHTGFSRLQLIGHSMGATVMMVFLSSVPSYNSKVQLLTLMAPVVSVHTSGNPLITKVLKDPIASRKWFYDNEVWEFGGKEPLMHLLANTMCRPGSLFLPMCDKAYDQLFGVGARPRIPDLLPIVFAYSPAGTSHRVMEHYACITIAKKFRPLDEEGFLLEDPASDYNLTAITAPSALYYSETDGLADPREVEYWSQKFGNLVRLFKVGIMPFNHEDFVMAKKVRTAVYRPLIQLMKEYEDRD